MTNKKYNELLRKHGAKELAENFVFPAKLSPAQKKESDAALAEALKIQRAAMKPEDKLNATLLQLRFEIEDYLKESRFDKHKTFSYFLKSYISSWGKKQSQFAREISVKPTELSQYINKHRKPTVEVIIRLELHSGNVISATNWYQLLQKEKLYELGSNKSLRAKQKPFVKKESNRIPQPVRREYAFS